MYKILVWDESNPKNKDLIFTIDPDLQGSVTNLYQILQFKS